MASEASRPASLMQTTRQLLSRFDQRAKKSLGQHFLVDAGVLHKIIEAAELSPGDTVIEVGPGLGVLTAELTRRAGRVIAVELDDNLAVVLKDTLSWAENLAVVHGNILELAPSQLLENSVKPSFRLNGGGYKVVANLPYYITSAVLRHFLEAEVKPSLMVVMVQKEVARAITAQPGEMSLLSVAVQFYGEPKIISKVPARSFYPAPNVDSAILKIKVYPTPPLPAADTEGFFGLVRAGFCANRKQLVNSLAQGLAIPKDRVLLLLTQAGIEPRRRAETLSIKEWGDLWSAFKRRNGQ